MNELNIILNKFAVLWNDVVNLTDWAKYFDINDEILILLTTPKNMSQINCNYDIRPKFILY
jgi:hypothetical protein